MMEELIDLIHSGNLAATLREDPPWQTFLFDGGRPTVRRARLAWDGQWLTVDEFDGAGCGWARLCPYGGPVAAAVVAGCFEAETCFGADPGRHDTRARLPAGSAFEVLRPEAWRTFRSVHGAAIAVTLGPRPRSAKLGFEEVSTSPLSALESAALLDRTRRALDLVGYMFRP